MRSEEVALVFPTMFRANNFQTNRVGYDDNHVALFDTALLKKMNILFKRIF